MFLNRVNLRQRMNGQERCGNGRRDPMADPLADPLEGAEWRGLLWIVPLLSWLAGGHDRWRAKKARRRRRDLPVSGWSRSSAGSRDAGIPHRSAC